MKLTVKGHRLNVIYTYRPLPVAPARGREYAMDWDERPRDPGTHPFHSYGFWVKSEYNRPFAAGVR